MKLNLKKKPSALPVNIVTKITLGIFVFIFLMGTVYIGIKPYRTQLHEGDISLRDIFAPFDFTYLDEVDEKATEKLREEVLKKIKPVYRFDSSKLVNAEKSITDFFEHLREARNTSELFGDDEKLKALRSRLNADFSNISLLTFIRTEKLDEAEGALKRTVYEVADRGILSDADKELYKKRQLETVVIYDPLSNSEEEINVAALLSVDKAEEIVEKGLNDAFPKDRQLKKAIRELAHQFLEPNLELDSERIQKKKDEAVTKIQPVYKEKLVKKNELLIARGQKIAKTHLKRFEQLNIMETLQSRLSYFIGLALILAIFLILIVIYLGLYQPKILKSNKNLLLIALNTVFIASLSEAIVLSPWPSYLIPVASIAMLLTILINADVAFLISILMSVFCGVIAGSRFGVTIVFLAGSFVGIYSVMKVRRRAKLFLAGLLVGATNFLCIVGIGYLNDLMPRVFLSEGMWGFLNGLLSFFIVIGALPILEYLFKITTDITLLELSDMNHPVLKEMVTKAPGTYHHSILVGNLAEAACDAIGAHSLLARIGAYYHDIGKIEKPEYFSENETESNSRHEGLTASMSALVITSHVKDGVELARRYKLNPMIIDFIEQHHGTSLIYYFYQKALEKGMGNGQLKEEEFRYPGPKPQTREAAIVLLADSVEASSRTLANPIPSRIKDLVQRIINNKFIDNQLGECDLTLKDLNKISDSFVRTLSGVFHTRVEYPQNADNRGYPRKSA